MAKIEKNTILGRTWVRIRVKIKIKIFLLGLWLE